MTIDPVNVPALKNAENLSAREYLARRLRLLDAAQARRRAVRRRRRHRHPDRAAHAATSWPRKPAPEKFWARNRGIVHNLVPVNFLTLCAATLPVGLDRLGLPVGLQLIAKGGDDERLVAIACAAERVLGTPRERLGVPPMCKA